jgi:hypothetical protein
MARCRDALHKVAALLVCLSTVIATGTTVAVLRTPERIVVGADTLGYESGQATHLCKIQREGAIFFSFAHFIVDKKSGFSAPALAHSAASGASIRDAAFRFKRLVLPAFAKALRRLQHDGPQFYVDNIKSGPTPLSALFLGVEHGVPKFYVVAVKVVDDTHGRMRLGADILECPGSYCTNGFGGAALGANEVALEASKNSLVWTGFLNDPVSGVRKMVEMEIADKPKYVGPPIDIVSVNGSGSHVEQVGLCHF